MRSRAALAFAFLAGCASQGAGLAGDSGGAGGAPPASAPGGGGVSFGGAQDIGDFRAILDRGELPGPDTLDANGFFNEHFNAPAPAACGNLLCITPGLSVGRDWLTGAHQATLQIAVESTLDPATIKRLPLRLVVVVDHSGSMASDGRLSKVQVGLHTMIDHLQEGDQVALVEFDDQVDVATQFTTDHAKLHTIVDELTPRGGTDIFAGLQAGFALLGDEPSSTTQNRVIFLSDGLASSGDTSPTDILAMAEGHVARGVGLTTVGVGNEFDIHLMRGLAERGAGNFYFLEDATAATEVFTEELDYFVQPIALDVQIDTTAGPGYRLGESVGSTLWQAQDDAQRGALLIPAVFAASRTTQSGGLGRRGGGSMIFIAMTPTTGNTGRVADITLSYRQPGATARTVQHVALDYASDPNETPEQPYLSSPQMAERYAMYNMFLGLRAATRSYDPSCAIQILQATRSHGSTWNASHEDPDLAADLELVDKYLGNLTAHPVVGTYPDGTAAPSAPPALGTCVADGTPPPDHGQGPEPTPIDPDTHDVVGCSAGGASGGLPVLIAAIAAIPLRRRRRF
ncbi:MAG TPA: VWA domain-containing protein [Kofleriaceae bacterium]|nr:VWA domain-containing protein [Kofleriaceae bacterium]